MKKLSLASDALLVFVETGTQHEPPFRQRETEGRVELAHIEDRVRGPACSGRILRGRYRHDSRRARASDNRLGELEPARGSTRAQVVQARTLRERRKAAADQRGSRLRDRAAPIGHADL